MKQLFIIIIAFVIGAVFGATRGLQKMQSEAINLATHMYEDSMNTFLSGGTVEFEGNIENWKEKTQNYLSGQIATIKEQAKIEAKGFIQKQIEKIFH